MNTIEGFKKAWTVVPGDIIYDSSRDEDERKKLIFVVSVFKTYSCSIRSVYIKFLAPNCSINELVYIDDKMFGVITNGN